MPDLDDMLDEEKDIKKYFLQSHIHNYTDKFDYMIDDFLER